MGLRERFWAKVEVDPDGCWEWTGAKARGGYGHLRRGGRAEGFIGAHQASWEIHHGPVPKGAWVLHTCDNPACVRPEHLRLGDVRQNPADMVERGRSTRLPLEDRARAVQLLAAGVPPTQVAADVGIALTSVYRLRRAGLSAV